MIKGTTSIVNTALRRGSKDFSSFKLGSRRNSICGPCNQSYYSTSKILVLNDESISNLTDFGQAIYNEMDELGQQPITKPIARKNSITDYLSSLTKSKSHILDDHERRFSLDTLSTHMLIPNNMNNNHSLMQNPILEIEPLDKIKSLANSDRFLQYEAESTFSSVWSDLVAKNGLENLQFPSEVIFLAGAPGSGKGTNTEILKEVLNVQDDPVVVSSLLNSPECQEIKKQGGLVNDKLVFELLLKEISKPTYGTKKGAVMIDGFPRSAKQVKFVELLYEKLCYLKRSVNSHATLPKFRVSILHVSEEESIARQIYRGKQAIQENVVRKERDLPLLEIRDTDTDPEASKKRYSLYQDQFTELCKLKSKFEFNLIDANGSKDQVQDIIRETYSLNNSNNNNSSSSNNSNNIASSISKPSFKKQTMTV
ncbi:hypothetical protein CYY_003829 [Polysphondylium violaceum]|uniref:Adenylate kinase n=1 Tax=Polysphondylium violaceum TaxID=133409 RepID=A0A8J4PZ50_9MYCE|nr:hypothetical protein CYY_003829 [Polysphondylium violaceum]